jgi:tol-pal system protein YbgF
MRRFICSLALFTLLLPGSMFAASKEQQEMQRDIAQLQDQVRMLQSAVDQGLGRLQTLVEQSLEAGNKANNGVNVLSSTVTQTMQRELQNALRPIAGITAKIDNVANDSAELRNSLTDLTAQMNRVIQLLSDMNNAIKVLQTPPVPPPSSNTNPDSTGARSVAPPPASVLWSNATSDYSSGKSELAVGEFTDFLHFYPDDPFAPNAQYFIGQTHLAQGKYAVAVSDLDAVLERYPESKVTPDAYFMKGMALKNLNRHDDAAAEFRTVIRKYPKSDRAPEAAEQLRAMGLSPGTPAFTNAARRKK